MRRILFLVAGLLMATTTAFAFPIVSLGRGHRSIAAKATAQTAQMTQRLALLPQQVAAVQPLNEQYNRQLAEAQKFASNRTERRERVFAAETTYDEQLQTILSPEQMMLYDQLRAHDREVKQQTRYGRKHRLTTAA